MPGIDDIKQLGSANWNAWFNSLSGTEKVIVLIQSWSMMQVAKRGLYDRVLGPNAATEYSKEMEQAFDLLCDSIEMDPQFIKDTMSSVTDEIEEYIG